MPPQNLYFAGGPADTTIEPLAACFLLVTILSLFLVRRKYIVVPILSATLLIPIGNVFVLAGVHLMPIRIVVLFAWIRIMQLKLLSGFRPFSGRLNRIDVLFLGWALCRALAMVMLWQSADAVVNQCGFLWTTLGMYFLLRALVRDQDDIRRCISSLIAIALIVASGMLYEQLALRNVFGLFLGGVQTVPLIRDGRIRSQGPFGHAILAGTYGATLVPLAIWMWKVGKTRILAALGFISAPLLILMCASSTPVAAYLAGLAAICFWPWRRRTRVLWITVSITILCLQLVMKAPVWFLIARVDFAGGSAAYDRALLIDTFVRHFGDWWLVGTTDNASWGWSMWDTSNQFVEEGNRGGLITLVLFITVILCCFRMLKAARLRLAAHSRIREWGNWLLASALLAHVAAFFGISYWDQTQLAWFTLLAMIGASLRSYRRVARIVRIAPNTVGADTLEEAHSVGSVYGAG